jgi:hypothetical protein
MSLTCCKRSDGTLLFDLLTRDEESIDEQTSRLHIDIRLEERIIGSDIKIGYFEAMHLSEEPGKLEEVARLPRSDLSVICLPDPCGILALFVF